MPTVLLVDDSPVVRRVLTQRLVAEGFDVRAEPSAPSTSRSASPTKEARPSTPSRWSLPHAAVASNIRSAAPWGPVVAIPSG